MISTLGHNLRGHNNRPILLLRHSLLSIENTILKGLAKFLRGSIVFPHQALGQAPQNLGQNNATITPGSQHSRICHPPCQAANTFIDRIRQRQYRSSHSPQYIRPGLTAVKKPAVFLQLVNFLIFQDKLTIGTNNHTLVIGACDYFIISHNLSPILR